MFTSCQVSSNHYIYACSSSISNSFVLLKFAEEIEELTFQTASGTVLGPLSQMATKTSKKLDRMSAVYKDVCTRHRQTIADSTDKIRSLNTDLKGKPDLKFHPTQKAVHGVTNEIHQWGFRHQVISDPNSQVPTLFCYTPSSSRLLRISA